MFASFAETKSSIPLSTELTKASQVPWRPNIFNLLAIREPERNEGMPDIKPNP